MKSMIEERRISFKSLEQEIFQRKCLEAQEETRELLMRYDKELHAARDTKVFRDKGLRKTVIKTVYGEVEYSRHVYRVIDEHGAVHYEYLLDKVLGMERVGKYSENFIDLLVSDITNESFRGCANSLSEKTGQSISSMGVWNAVQTVGEQLMKEEKDLAKANEAGLVNGEKEVPVLFEEIDGVYLTMQREDRKNSPKGIAEMKVALAYDGWIKESEGRYALDGKVAFAGFSKAEEFHEIREAKIAVEYNLDETKMRILNADGAEWIKDVPDRDTIFQLDPYHRNKEIIKKIPYKLARECIRDYLWEDDIKGLFEYLQTYHDSLTDADEIEKAEDLIRYFKENKKGLISYKRREKLKLPKSPQGLEYRNMGVMENHVYSMVAQRMKHQHRSWKKKSATNLAKILAKKAEGRLYEVTKPQILKGFDPEQLERMKRECLSAAKSTEKVGEGYEYPISGSLVAMEEALRGDPKKLFGMAGY